MFLLPFFLALFQIIYIVFNKFYPFETVNLILHLYSISFGEMFIKLLPLILKIKSVPKEKEQLIKRKKWLHYSILTFLYIINRGINFGADIFDIRLNGKEINYSGTNLFPNNDLILMSTEMIFMILVSIWLLKYKYYKHHIISTIIFLIFGIIGELCLGKYFTSNGLFFLGRFIVFIS